MSAAGVTAAKTLIDTFGAGDADTAFSQVHPEGVIHEADELWYGGDWTGPDGLRELIGVMSEKREIEILGYEVYDADVVAVMNANIRFTSRATGRSIETTVVELYREKDGKLIDMDIFYKDTKAVIDLAHESAAAPVA